jgi:hypothetical protein
VLDNLLRVLFLASLRTNMLLAIVLAFLCLSYLFLAIGAFADANTVLLAIGGWLGIICALVSWYAALAGILQATRSPFQLPMGAPVWRRASGVGEDLFEGLVHRTTMVALIVLNSTGKEGAIPNFSGKMALSQASHDGSIGNAHQ